MISYQVLLFSFLYAVFNVTGAAIIKSKLTLGGVSTPKDIVVFLFDTKIIIAMVFIFVSMFFSIKALSLDKFSLVIPVLTGVNFLLTIGVGCFIFKDELALTSYMGIMLIMIGIWLLAVGGSL